MSYYRVTSVTDVKPRSEADNRQHTYHLFGDFRQEPLTSGNGQLFINLLNISPKMTIRKRGKQKLPDIKPH